MKDFKWHEVGEGVWRLNGGQWTAYVHKSLGRFDCNVHGLGGYTAKSLEEGKARCIDAIIDHIKSLQDYIRKFERCK